MYLILPDNIVSKLITQNQKQVRMYFRKNLSLKMEDSITQCKLTMAQ